MEKLSEKSAIAIMWELIRRGWIYIPEKRLMYHPLPHDENSRNHDDDTYGMSFTVPESEKLITLLTTLNFN